MFSPRHQSLVDDFGGIVAPGVNMDALFDDRIRACSQSLSNLVSTGLDLRLLLRLLAAHRGRPVETRARAMPERGLGREERRSVGGKASVASCENENGGGLTANFVLTCRNELRTRMDSCDFGRGKRFGD